MNIFYIGFDFSINKPAATILAPDNNYYFFAWPCSLTKSADEAYKSLNSNFIKVINRNVDIITDKDESIMTYKHTIRSYELAKQIITDIDMFISEHCIDESEPIIYMASEGLSFASRGNVTLNLATYKGVFLALFCEMFSSLLKHEMIYTYSPISIKSVANCAGKEARNLKDPMIQAFLKEPENALSIVLKDDILKSKNNKYYACVDDIVDSYWVLQTMIKKEKLL